MSEIEVDKFRVTVLCEDKSHFHFVKGYLEALGFNRGKINGKIAISGRGSGEQYVRKWFPRMVKDHRRFKLENIILIVVTDADGYTYDKRLKTLTSTLEKQLSEDEKIVILVPTRNIETWFWYADNPTKCNEQEDYKSKYNQPKNSKYGEKYAKDICPSLPKDTLMALQETHTEIERLNELLSSQKT